MFDIKELFELIRLKQWYKNIVIFIPLIFSFNLFNFKMLFLDILGFFSLCFLSSGIYIINDLKDIERDRQHPEKKKRPLASRRIQKIVATFLFIILLVDSLFLAYFLSREFFYALLTLFVFSQAYIFYFREVFFVDILLISINFVIRSISGIFLLNIKMSYWIVLCTFFLSVFLVSSKRLTEIDLPQIEKYRKCYYKEKKETLKAIVVLSMSALIIFFSIYGVFNRPSILISLPIALYVLFLYYTAIYKSPEKIREPERFIYNKKIIFSLIIWIILIIFSLYFFTLEPIL